MPTGASGWIQARAAAALGHGVCGGRFGQAGGAGVRMKRRCMSRTWHSCRPSLRRRRPIGRDCGGGRLGERSSGRSSKESCKGGCSGASKRLRARRDGGGTLGSLMVAGW